MKQANQKALVLLLAGFTVWSGGFVLLYGLQALGCAYDWAYHRIILIAAYILVLVPLCGLALMRPMKEGEPAHSLSVAAFWANRAALGAGVLVFLPVTFTSACL